MKWLTNLFRRGDIEAAHLAVEKAIATDVAPNIEEIAEQTGVGVGDVHSFLVSALAEMVFDQVAKGLVAGSVPSQEIYDCAIRLGLAAHQAKDLLEEAVSGHFTKQVSEILDDGQVDPSEDARIQTFMNVVGQSVIGAETDAAIERGRALYRVHRAPLTPVDAPVLLQRGEFCVHVVAAVALEERSRTVRINYHGPRMRLRIAKGLYYTAGSIQPLRQSEEYQHSFGTGALCMTNKRLLWVSPSKSISIRLSNIVRFDSFSDGLRVFKGSGKPLLFIWQEEDMIATIMAQRTIEELR